MADIVKRATQWIANHFKTPSALQLAARELDMAERELLRTLSAVEYAARMAEYHKDRIKRLKAYVSKVTLTEEVTDGAK